jgi:hypothetical protein
MRNPIKATLILTGFLSISAFSGIQETLPSWHWAYAYIDELRMRGDFDSLSVMNCPYTRGEVAHALMTIITRHGKDLGRISRLDKKIVLKLVREFRPEMETLQSEGKKAEYPRVGLRLQENIDEISGSEPKLKGVYRSRIAVPLGRYGEIYNGMTFDQYLVDDPRYVGKKWRSMVVYTEQAYLALGTDKLRIKLGRDYLRWGAGRSGTLLFWTWRDPWISLTLSSSMVHSDIPISPALWIPGIPIRNRWILSERIRFNDIYPRIGWRRGC